MTSKQRAKLKSLAMSEDTILQVGKGGISEALIKQIDDALTARELIKIKVLETAPDDIKDIAGELLQATDSEVVQIIGTKIVFFRINPENNKIKI
ncbi:MAG: ribosome assembly RNA-binding protein YhbY [Oscillospiraceae bacterium]